VFILNSGKTKELIIHLRKSSAVITPLYINGDRMEIFPGFRFLGTFIAADLTRVNNTTEIVKKAQRDLIS